MGTNWQSTNSFRQGIVAQCQQLFEDRLVAASVQLQNKLTSSGTSSGGNTVVQIVDLATEEMAEESVTTRNRRSAGANFISGHLNSRRC